MVSTQKEDYINFDQFASLYDQTRTISDELLDLLLKSFLEVHKDHNMQSILEIGCGTGRIAKIFAKNSFHVTGIDVSQKMLDLAIKKARDEQWNFTGLIADARNLPFSDNNFDVAYTVHVLHLIKDWKKVIREALRCSNNRFINIFMERRIFSSPIMSNYWQFIKENDPSVAEITDKKLGAKNADEVNDYMSSINYSYIKKEFTCDVAIKKEELVKIANSKSFSSQRFLSDSLHQKAMSYLQTNNYFLPEEEFIKLEERGIVYSFFKV